MISTDPNYVNLLAGQLVGQAKTTPDRAAELHDFEVPDTTPTTLHRSAHWARTIHSGTLPLGGGTSTTLARAWPGQLSPAGRRGGKHAIDKTLQSRD
ncbi:hypothetical protein AB0D90_23535 [Streptomyces althioticus]|uniref:hypothetical protein n=1 Tax=Streptomyces althioticus TaxID=83380 RepID=UPI0033E032E3